jgi:hypothetical protein
MRGKSVVWCLVACLAPACGGRYVSDPQGGDGAAGSDNASAGTNNVGSAGTSAAGSSNVCEQQRQDYAAQRDQVVAEFADFSCVTAKNCLAAFDPSNCAHDCSYVIVTAAGRGVLDRLVILGQRTCTGDCVSKDAGVCPSPPVPECVMGKCVLTSLK